MPEQRKVRAAACQRPCLTTYRPYRDSLCSIHRTRAPQPVGKKAKRPLTPKQGGAPASADTPPSTPKRGAATVPDDLGPRLASITIDDCNPLVRKAEYAVRGRLLTRSKELEAELKAGATLPFQQIVRCNIGNPQALGQPPLSYVRQTLALLMDRSLIDSPEVAALYKPDILDRARAYSGAVASVGAYSDSQGIALVRQHVSDFIAARDGFPASADDIFLTDGASSGVKMWMQLLVRGPQDAVLAPIPQYPLYSAVTTMLDGTLAGYYLDESADWGVNEAELRRALERAREQGAVPRAMVVINPCVRGDCPPSSWPRTARSGCASHDAAASILVRILVRAQRQPDRSVPPQSHH